MANFYKKIKLSFRGNFPLIEDMDEALKDPYRLHNNVDEWNLKTPGDNSTSGYGTDYYKDRKPPVSSIDPEYAVRPKWHGDFDGEDADQNDEKPAMESGDALYDSDSPIGRSQEIQRRVKDDRDNTGVGPFNQQKKLNKTVDFFDKIKRRLRN